MRVLVFYTWVNSKMSCYCSSGNELSGNGVGTRVAANQYAFDTVSLRNLVQNIYSDVEPKPQIIAPGGFFDQKWFSDFLNKTAKSLDVITHHIYNLGPGTVPEETDSLTFLRHIEKVLFLKVYCFFILGVDTHLIEKILDPSYLDGEANTFGRLQSTINSSASSAASWVGEAGGAYNSGRNLVTNAFVFSFW